MCCLTLDSCFTGIESTPRIGQTEMKKRNVGDTPESLLLSGVLPQPFSAWNPGKEFLITDSRISMIFGVSGSSEIFVPGDTLVYTGYSEVESPTGKAVELIFRNKKNPNGNSLSYRINSPLKEFSQREEVDVPFTVELSVANTVRNKIEGETVYILTSRWLDSKFNYVTRLKFIPIKIIKVEAGIPDLPVRIEFLPTNEPTLQDQTYSVYMSVGGGPKATRNFETLFSLTDPHKKYTWITDENWELIKNNRVSLGMTRDEARLALGAPIDVDRGHDYSSTYERWVYDGGVYLIFRDGILESFRR